MTERSLKLETYLNGTGERTKRLSFERRLPSTIGEIGFHTECFRAIFPLKMSCLIQENTKQDKVTTDERFKEVPESEKTVCRESELVRGYEAQDRVVPGSFAHLRIKLLY